MGDLLEMETDLGTQLEGGKRGEGLHCVEGTLLLAEREVGNSAEELNPFLGEPSVE